MSCHIYSAAIVRFSIPPLLGEGREGLLPFGELFIEERTTWNTPYKFSGKELDDETGYSYFGARYYDPNISIWLSVDPLSDKYPNQTPYHYVSNNPINRFDPYGETDYELDKKSGRITEVKGTSANSGPDRLIAGSARYDKKTKSLKNSNFIEVEKDVFSQKNKREGKNGEYTLFQTSTDQKSEDLFKFLSNNSDVEFTKSDLENNGQQFSIFFTTHNSKSETISTQFLTDLKQKNPGMKLISDVHNHNSYMDDSGNYHWAQSTPSGKDTGKDDLVEKNHLMGVFKGQQPRSQFNIYLRSTGKMYPY